MTAATVPPVVLVTGAAKRLGREIALTLGAAGWQVAVLSPLGCSSTAHDVAAAVKFALDNRSITGTTLLVDGGQHLMQFERDFSLM